MCCSKLAVELNGIYKEERFPFFANHGELSRNDIHELIQVGLGNLAAVVCNDASSLGGQPNLGCIGRWGALADVHMNRFVAFVRPEEYAVSANEKQTRQL